MKRITALLFLTFIIRQTNAQYLVVDNPIYGGNNIPFQDTILSSIDTMGFCTSLNYYFDLDQDSIQDIDFYLDCYMGGLGSGYFMSLTSFNNFSIHIDTSYVEHFQFINNYGQVQDTSRIIPTVRKYNWGDTIFSNQSILAAEGNLLNFSYGNYPPCVYNGINLFLEDTSYISLEKSNGDLYYLKIYVPSYSALELIYAKTNAQVSVNSVNELPEHYIFPNPAKEIINFRKAFDLIQIYTMQGTLLIEKKLSYSQKAFDISNLKSGFYTVILKTNRKRYITKLLKL